MHGSLSYVIFTTKSIHDVKVRELENFRKLRDEMAIAGDNAFISKPLFRSRLVKTFSSLVGSDEHAA